jgi:hypothetical protein
MPARRSPPPWSVESGLVVPHLHRNRPANLYWLISNKTDGYAGRHARNRATACPNNYVSVGRALAGIRIGVGRRAVLLKRRLGLGNSAGNLIVGGASLPYCNYGNDDSNEDGEHYKPIVGDSLPVVDFSSHPN